MTDSSTHTSTPSTPDGRPARDDEVRPSDEMQSADRANGEPDAIDADRDTTDADRGKNRPHNDETGNATLVTDEPGE